MSELGKFCCFVCPGPDQTERRLDDHCPTCGRQYGFPLRNVPASIGEFEVLRSLSRGFYGATFVARRRSGLSRTPKVLKVSPADMYRFFNKDFGAEMHRHAEAAEGAAHIVGVDDMFDADVAFGDLTLHCHVGVLDFVDGDPLARYLSGAVHLSAAEAAQIASDLFRMKEEFERRLVNHNDLHASNIIVERLPASHRRADAIEPSIRAMAIDLGSIAPDRRSGSGYLGDLHWIGRHIHAMASRLLVPIDSARDLENRIGLKLHGIAQGLATITENQRTPSADDMIRGIQEEYHRTAEPWRPWRNQRVLKTFAESYNAQTLDAWYVPQLLVDPEGAWLARVSAPGPLVMTGMRGCGKTMLLHSLQFHARAAVQPHENDADALRRITQDGYVGLFVSAQRLIPVDPTAERPSTDQLFARLLVAYAVAASRAMAHLGDLDGKALAFDACAGMVHAVANSLKPIPEIGDPANTEQLERFLGNLLARVSRSDSEYRLATNANAAFPLVADAIRRASPVWADSQVLFLLDDVSTRYLDAQRIEDLLSSLIFHHPHCAFKVTSEAQTIFLSLKSPGKVHAAAAGRDFETFDLGAQVQARLKDRSGRAFVLDVLKARARLYAGHRSSTPDQVLGDIDLESIARSIAETQTRSRERKRLYHGLRALAGVCVGNIGTVIQIYQEMLVNHPKVLPVSPERQNEIFQEFCARHLYSLDRRGSDLKAVATQFAEASHQLLMESGKERPTGRIRQYTSIYVRVTSGDVRAQMNRLRELVDAGVFVFTGGTARTKTHDSDPVQQFKLTFMKIFGLANFIGLADRDRFELSGADLEKWLDEPELGRELLLRNLSKAVPPMDGEIASDEEADDDPSDRTLTAKPYIAARQMDWLDGLAAAKQESESPALNMPMPVLPSVSELLARDLDGEQVDTLVVGLGFEERTPASLRRLLRHLRPKRILAVRYENIGRSEAMRTLVAKTGLHVDEVDYAAVAAGDAPKLGGRAMIDVTGLAKSALFGFVRSGLSACDSILIAYTAAKQYYPLETELRSVLDAYRSDDPHSLLTALRGILTGEVGPYRSIPLLTSESDQTRLRALSAFASSKHERLLHLVGEREYDIIEVLTDSSRTSRANVGRIAARVALEETPNGQPTPVDAADLSALVEALGRRHQDWYVRGGLNFEIGLTGNKMQATAAAVISAALPVNQVWYVRPAIFDESRFTHGVGRSRFFRVDLH